MPEIDKPTLSAVPGNADEWLVVDAEGFVVAIVRDRKLEGLRAEEFARLFAAAPELHPSGAVALGVVQASIVNAKLRKAYPQIISNLERIECSLRAAIAKVRGES